MSSATQTPSHTDRDAYSGSEQKKETYYYAIIEGDDPYAQKYLSRMCYGGYYSDRSMNQTVAYSSVGQLLQSINNAGRYGVEGKRGDFLSEDRTYNIVRLRRRDNGYGYEFVDFVR